MKNLCQVLFGINSILKNIEKVFFEKKKMNRKPVSKQINTFCLKSEK